MQTGPGAEPAQLVHRCGHNGSLNSVRSTPLLDVVQPSFRNKGGSEYAPMSTTSDVRVALQYAQSERSLLFKIKTASFLQRGADLDYLSAFPGEHEILFPPLTHLLPTGRSFTQTFEENGMTVEVIEVRAIMP